MKVNNIIVKEFILLMFKKLRLIEFIEMFDIFMYILYILEIF